MSGAYYPPSIPRVKGVAPAGERAAALTLESGEVVTVTATGGTVVHRSGLLVADYRSPDSPAYLLPNPHLGWQAKVRLGLYGSGQDSEEARFDAYLMNLSSITQASWADGVLSITHVGRTGQRYACQFTEEVTVNFIDAADSAPSDFTRFPLRVAIQEKENGIEYVIGFRVDHTPEGYAALKALGWLAELPALEGVRPADHLNAAD